MTSIAQVKRRLAEQAGLDPSLLDREWFERIIRGRLKALGLDSSRAYCERLDRDASELQRLVEHVSVTETWFFRYPDSFELLLRHLTALRSAENQPARLRMLSVACATGQEPYSMAMTATQAGWPLDSVTLDAVDRNEGAIVTARQARYPRRALRDDAPGWAAQWLHPEGDHLVVDARITAAVRWIVADILQPPASVLKERYDIVFCRNLLIYLHASARSNLVKSLSAWLSSTGLLFVGHAERIEALRPRFQAVAEPHTFALCARDAERPSLSTSDGSDRRPTKALAAAAAAARVVTQQRDAAKRSSETLPPPSRREADENIPVAELAKRFGRHGESPRVLATSATPSKSLSAARPGVGALASGGRPSPDGVPTLREASALADSGDLDNALLAVEATIEAQPASAEAFALQGNIYLAQGDLPAARQALIKSLYLDAHREETLLQMALVHQRLGNQPQALRYRRRAAQAHQAGSSEESE